MNMGSTSKQGELLTILCAVEGAKSKQNDLVLGFDRSENATLSSWYFVAIFWVRIFSVNMGVRLFKNLFKFSH